MLKGFRDWWPSGQGQVFVAKLSATSLPIYSGTGMLGPLLYNGSNAGGGKGVTAWLLALSYGLTTASTVAGSIGIAGGQTTSPTGTSTTGLLVGNANLQGPASACSIYAAGTISQAGSLYLPTGRVHTGAITVDTDDDNFIHLGGVIAVPPGYWACPAAGATLTSAVIDLGLVWVEIPND